MPMRNRVAPTGELLAVPLRCAWTGNRGILHHDRDIVRFHGGNLWITCALSFKGWRLRQWAPGHFTLLFFHDEAVALAAGHRPCALCRRADYNAYRDAWATGLGVTRPLAVEINRQLHAERLHRGTHVRRLHTLPWRDLPDGVFVLRGGVPAVLVGDATINWTSAGYREPARRLRRGDATVLTPPATTAALLAGYRPQIDTSALNALHS
jgi:hypothetical protein